MADPVAAAQEYSQMAAAQGLRRHECHLCFRVFAKGTALNAHLENSQDSMHAEHRARMRANANISKEASIEHRAAMAREDDQAKRGVGARVVFLGTGDRVVVVERLDASWAWGLAGGRICKFKTEGQRWQWECDWLRNKAD